MTSDGIVDRYLEAGCNKERADQILNDSAIERVKQLGYEQGDRIARIRPHVLLQDIARNAIRLIGADSASVHVYRRKPTNVPAGEELDWGELILAAGAGRATPEYVQSDKPRERGRGSKAIEIGQADMA